MSKITFNKQGTAVIEIVVFLVLIAISAAIVSQVINDSGDADNTDAAQVDTDNSSDRADDSQSTDPEQEDAGNDVDEYVEELDTDGDDTQPLESSSDVDEELKEIEDIDIDAELDTSELEAELDQLL